MNSPSTNSARVMRGSAARRYSCRFLSSADVPVVEVDRPIREQGIYKRDVRVGHNVWIGYGACVLRGVSVGDNSILGTSSVVTKDVPENAVVAGAPARVIRMRDAPRSMRWE